MDIVIVLVLETIFGGAIMIRFLIILMFFSVSTAYSQDISGGGKFSGENDINESKANKGVESIKDLMSYYNISSIRQMNYEITGTGDLVLKQSKPKNKKSDTSIEENFDKNSNICPTGLCGTNLLFWGAVSVLAGFISVISLKKQ